MSFIKPFPDWQTFQRRADNRGLNVMQVKQKYLTEQYKYYQMIPPTPSFAAAAGGAGSTDTGATPYVSTYSLDFDGIDDFVNCGDSDTFTFGDGTTDSPFSVSAWFKADTLTGNERFTIGKFDSGAEWLMQGRETFISMALYEKTNAGHSLQTKYTATINTGVWINVIFTYDGSSETTGCKMYINGSLVSTSNTKGSDYVAMGNKSSDLKIGARSGKEFDGKIDETAIFSSELSLSDVSTIYNGGVPGDLSSLSPLHWWKFNEGSGTTAIDAGSGGVNGTINGATYSTDVPG